VTLWPSRIWIWDTGLVYCKNVINVSFICWKIIVTVHPIRVYSISSPYLPSLVWLLSWPGASSPNLLLLQLLRGFYLIFGFYDLWSFLHLFVSNKQAFRIHEFDLPSDEGSDGCIGFNKRLLEKSVVGPTRHIWARLV
jgi:hypothetical protein